MKNRSWARQLVSVVLSVGSGILLALVIPPAGHRVIGWFALLPLLLVSRLQGRPLFAAVYGLLTALITAALCAGNLSAISQFGNLLAAFGTLGLLLALVLMVSQFACRRLSPAMWAVCTACAGVGAELVCAWVFPATIALSQYRNPAALAIASVTGVWGISFLLWLIPASAMAATAGPRRLASGLTLIVSILALAVTPSPRATGRTTVVAAMQESRPDMARMMTQQMRWQAEFFVWPEFLTRSPQEASDAARAADAFVAASFSANSPDGKPRNSARIFDPDGRVIGTFYKKHLFGREITRFVGWRAQQSPVLCNGTRVGVAICYDTEFADVTRDLARRGAQLILVPNSDPNMPNCLFNHLHRAIIPFRAAENGVPIAWSEPNGLSCVVDGDGRIMSDLPPGANGTAYARVHPRRGTTVFTLAGDWFAYAALLAVPALLLLGQRGNRK